MSAAHIPGHLNPVADEESRARNVDAEWQLRSDLFSEICTQFGTPEVDLFASRINAQLPKYVSWQPDPTAIHIESEVFFLVNRQTSFDFLVKEVFIRG